MRSIAATFAPVIMNATSVTGLPSAAVTMPTLPREVRVLARHGRSVPRGVTFFTADLRADQGDSRPPNV